VARRLSWLAWPVILSAPLLYVGFVRAYGVNVPYWDDWDQTQLIVNARLGTLRFADLWRQLGENRMLLPNALFLADAWWNHYNVKALLYLSAAFLALATALVVWAYRKHNPRASLFALAPFTILLFSPCQHQGTLWATYLSGYMAFAGTVAAVVLLAEVPGWWGLAFAAGCAVVGSLSALQGLFVWPCALLAAWATRRPRAQVMAWCAAAAVMTALYFRGFAFSNTGSPGLAFNLTHPWLTVQCILAGLGNPLLVSSGDGGPGPFSLAEAFGAVSLTLCGFLLLRLWRADRPSSAVPLALAAFGALFAVSAGIERAGAGLSEMFASRYSLYSLLLLVASWWSLSALWRRSSDRWIAAAGGAAAALLVLQGTSAYALAPAGMNAVWQWREHCAYVLTHLRAESDAAITGSLWYNAPQVRSDSLILKKYGLTAFYTSATTYHADGTVVAK